ncbi:site-specific integrase [Ancylomarina sp. 16SWW S1-10-2]|uniref:site-specific integrase n=1 Tax=Ancylomarina sp. 16SWW S1-10-2 TaxID=2499681 RepID=UPI0012ADCE9C|nr:site-specific integrase [Ancylomarina sp. 16SWW S1-10-2]MRT94676.1 site-specific integrase [Ancylomarina sp. 16SWW S1-10-2]
MNTFSTLNISFLIRKNRSNKLGEAPIYIRFSINNERVEISTGRSINPHNWDSKLLKAITKKKGAGQLNKFLEVLKNSIYDHHTEMVKNGDLISAKKLKARFLGIEENKKTLIQVFEYHNMQMKELQGISYAEATVKRYITTLDHVKRFLKHQYNLNDIPLTRLKYSFIVDFEHYFKTVRKCNNNSTYKYLKNMRKVINLAIRNEWLDKDPFAKYKTKLIEVKRECLNKEELKSLESLKLTFPRLEVVRDMFIFSCYTGLAYIDISNLTKDNIRIGIDGNLWILLEREKTKTPSNIPILPQANDLIKKYANHPAKKTEQHIFPSFSNQKLNAYLKELADLASIDKNLTFHIARHTFATTITLANGVPIESISSMLGHKNIRTTQIYSKVVNEKVSKDMSKLKRKLR